jgi:hypothetical protein
MPDSNHDPEQGSRQSARPRFFVSIMVMLAVFVALMMILLFVAN